MGVIVIFFYEGYYQFGFLHFVIVDLVVVIFNFKSVFLNGLMVKINLLQIVNNINLIYNFIYIYIYVCVCVEREREREREWMYRKLLGRTPTVQMFPTNQSKSNFPIALLFIIRSIGHHARWPVCTKVPNSKLSSHCSLQDAVLRSKPSASLRYLYFFF